MPEVAQPSPPNGDAATVATMDRGRVAMRAYELYLARGAADGQAMDDWLRAERELLRTEPRARSTHES